MRNRNVIIGIRQSLAAANPWLPWALPGAVGELDALNLIDRPATPLYLALIVAAATITTITQGTRLVCRTLSQRFERAAELAQVKEAALLAYQAAAEHCEARHQCAEVLPQAVGGETTTPLPGLRIVQLPSGDMHAARGKVYRSKVRNARAADSPQDQAAQLVSVPRQTLA